MDMTSGGSMLDLAGLLQNSMRNNEDGFLGGSNGILLLFILILFGGWGGNRWGNNGAMSLTNDAAITGAIDAAIQKARADGLSDKVVLEAINGNGLAISQLATTLNADINSVRDSLCALNSGVAKISADIGLSTQQTINAIQTGNMTLMQQLASCCCDIRESLAEGFNSVKIQNMEQTNTLSDRLQVGISAVNQKIDNQTAQMVAGFQSVKDMFVQNKIDTMQAKITQLENDASNNSQTFALNSYVNNALAPIIAQLNALTNAVPPRPVPSYPVAGAYSCAYNSGSVHTGCGCGTSTFGS